MNYSYAQDYLQHRLFLSFGSNFYHNFFDFYGQHVSWVLEHFDLFNRDLFTQAYCLFSLSSFYKQRCLSVPYIVSTLILDPGLCFHPRVRSFSFAVLLVCYFRCQDWHMSDRLRHSKCIFNVLFIFCIVFFVDADENIFRAIVQRFCCICFLFICTNLKKRTIFINFYQRCVLVLHGKS